MIQADPGPIPDRPLFHYTSVQGLLGIITSKCIWATDVLYLNDAAEFRYTLQLARQQVADLIKSGSPGDRPHLEQMDARLTHWMKFRTFAVFVASFSSRCDELSQWRAYAPYGAGFSIGFDFSKLKDELANQGFRLVKCIYDESEQQVKIKEALTEALHNLRKWQAEGADTNNRSSPVDCSQALFQTLIPLAPQLKHPKFSEEQEWRLVSRSMPSSLRRSQVKGVEPPWKYRPGKSMIIPYIEFRLAEKDEGLDCIPEVYVGPTPYSYLSEDSVASLLKNHLVTSFAVNTSGAPYRGNTIAG